jgi:hypothetical protein
MAHYKEERHRIFEEENQKDFLKVRDICKDALEETGAFKSGNIMTGDCWFFLNCLDRLVELGELSELTEDKDVRGQDRVFIKNRSK